MNTQVVIDSTIDLPEGWADENNIKSVPLSIIIEEDVYKDGVDLDLNTLHEKMEEGIVPKTSQITPKEFYEQFKDILESGKDLLYLGFSSELSGTFQAALTAADLLREEFPERKIEIVDSRGGAFAVGLIAVKLAQMDQEGATIEEMVKEAERMIKSTHYLFTLTNLDWLAKGGRISKAVSFIGDTLDIKPILTVKDGKLVVTKKVRGDKKADSFILKNLLEGVKNHPNQRFGIGHSNDLKRALRIKEKIEENIPGAEVIISEIGSVLTTHLGIGGIGVFWLDDDYFS